ncbi:hypothetical protein TIFTF001_020992 [Ficus carica]|uniref:Uncharacterized protein n=1 Tax=Ficus carica TaxID=3494 RepID=A0AA88AS56_FICCA|nr:hypothetical protein TIFTF001_020992 [Ficus carica]
MERGGFEFSDNSGVERGSQPRSQKGLGGRMEAGRGDPIIGWGQTAAGGEEPRSRGANGCERGGTQSQGRGQTAAGRGQRNRERE